MKDIQGQIIEAEESAKKELEVAIQYLKRKEEEATRKSKDLLDSSKKDSDDTFLSKKNILEQKIKKIKENAVIDFNKKVKKIESAKKSLIEKGVSLLLKEIIK